METERNGQKQTQIERNRQKRSETNKDEQKLILMDRNGQKRTATCSKISLPQNHLSPPQHKTRRGRPR